jgi:hypothetical protein
MDDAAVRFQEIAKYWLDLRDSCLGVITTSLQPAGLAIEAI